MRRLLLFLAFLFLVSSLVFGEEKRTYHKIAIADAATTIHTHAQIEGVVDYVKREADGDYHFRVIDGKGAFVVCEIVPWRAVRTVKKGQRVRVFGITRFDKKHNWPELHPVEDIQLIEAQP